MPTSACDATYRKLLPTASPFYASCAVSGDQFRRPCTRRLLSPSSCHGWITATLCRWAYKPTCTTACSRYSTLLLDRSPACDVLITSLVSFHCLKVPERVQYKLATIVYRSLNGKAIHYLAADLRRLSNMPSRRRLRSSLTHQLDIASRSVHCATVGDRTFAVAGARLWNSVPPDIVACDTLHRFRRELKTFLFRQSYPSIWFIFSLVILAVFT